MYKFHIGAGGEVAMGVGARSWWGLSLGLLMTGPAWGQASDAGPEPAPPQPAETSATPLPPSTPSDSLSPERLMAGPSLRETGRVAVSPVPMPSTAIENAGDSNQVSPTEKPITRAASTINVAPARRQGVIDQRALDREVAAHFADIAGCRVEVARAKQIKPPQVVADQILVRWTIDTDGSISGSEIVAIAPVDLGIMDCTKRAMSQWTFSRPRGGPVAVERKFKFAASVPGEK